MTLKEKEIIGQNGKFKIILSKRKFYILNHYTVEAAEKRAKEIANEKKIEVVLIDITNGSNYIDTIRPNLRLAKGGANG